MYASIRRYKLKLNNVKDFTRQVNEGFVPIIARTPGFVAYYGVDGGGGSWASVTIFQTKAGAEQGVSLSSLFPYKLKALHLELDSLWQKRYNVAYIVQRDMSERFCNFRMSRFGLSMRRKNRGSSD